MKKGFFKEIILDIFASIGAGIIVALGLHVFANSNGFAPGGLTGISSVLANLIGVNMGYIMIAFNIPILILISIFIEKKLGLYVSIYIATQSLSLIVLEKFSFPVYIPTSGNLIFAAIATGVVTGLGFSLQTKRHGTCGGTYAISALIKRWKPATNIAWLTFIFDSAVVILILILYENSIEPAICTILNLFIANLVVDYCLQGSKEGYKFEIITEDPETISQEIMAELKHGVTEMRVNGMYTHKEKYMIICIIRKRELSKMMKIIKRYPKSFASFARVNEVFGNFKK